MAEEMPNLERMSTAYDIKAPNRCLSNLRYAITQFKQIYQWYNGENKATILQRRRKELIDCVEGARFADVIFTNESYADELQGMSKEEIEKARSVLPELEKADRFIMREFGLSENDIRGTLRKK